LRREKPDLERCRRSIAVAAFPNVFP